MDSRVTKIEFTSTVHRLDIGIQPHGIPVPEDVAHSLRSEGVRRLLVKVNGFEMKCALDIAQKLKARSLHGDRKL